ncbi:unnamed protein product [Chondrus crispus]|uniref:Uncharacterized protein n=1 Tax=Chondrus crispus TaxID=2769 RepID=S0F3N7_CHOCR|nr:unnamed protein product [Chondrus crispus]CDF77574.1 unnamed protein product [Chondrus crispus]|eukprot:XP_005718075.1 unnamed protein product [Chondrus crispus]
MQLQAQSTRMRELVPHYRRQEPTVLCTFPEEKQINRIYIFCRTFDSVSSHYEDTQTSALLSSTHAFGRDLSSLLVVKVNILARQSAYLSNIINNNYKPLFSWGRQRLISKLILPLHASKFIFALRFLHIAGRLHLHPLSSIRTYS